MRRPLRSLASRNAREWIGLGITAFVVMGALALATAHPQLQWNYLTGILLTILIYSIFCMGISLSFGSTGLLNLGHAAFMLISAYVYGILTMPPLGRPDRPGPLVGYLYDHSGAFAGVSLGGLLVSLALAAIAGALVAMPTLLIAAKLLAGRPKRALVAGLAPGILVAVVLFARMFPLGASGAQDASVAVAILLGIALAVLVGLALGASAVRLRTDYLAIVTIGAAEILRSVALNEPEFTRGSLNIIGFPRPLNAWAIADPTWNRIAAAANVPPVPLLLALVALVAAAYVYLLLETLARSPWGRVMRAIREDEDAVLALGKNVFSMKLQSLMVSGAIGALAGVLLVTELAVVAPELFLPIVTYYGFMMVILGGVTTHKGAIAGAFLVWGVFSLVQAVPQLAAIGIGAGPGQLILVGVAFILVMMFRPQGLLGAKEEMLYAK
ncbi:MAG: branched-chain amino acid ABC transporter permease [Thermoplasmatota archaeon]